MGHSLTRLDMVVNVRFPGVRAHGIQVAAMAEALAETGLNVDVVVPRRFPYQSLDPWMHYGVRRTFGVCRIANIDTIDMFPPKAQRFPFLLQSITFGLRALARAAVERDAGILVRDHYTTEILVGGLRATDRQRIAAEVHNLPREGARRRRLARALSRLRAVITISEGLKDDLAREGVDAGRILVARDGVHLSRFGHQPGPRDARRHLSIPTDVPTVVYAGQLFPWKGVETLIEAVGHVPYCQLLVVGGDRHNLARTKKSVGVHAPGRVTFTGMVPHHEIPFYLAAADVIALPNSGSEVISRRYTSPLKLFEAMAARRPIVASDLPSLREVLEHERNALLVAPDDPVALARGIERLFENPRLGGQLAQRAAVDVLPFDWKERGRRVAHFLRERLYVGMR